MRHVDMNPIARSGTVRMAIVLAVVGVMVLGAMVERTTATPPVHCNKYCPDTHNFDCPGECIMAGTERPCGGTLPIDSRYRTGPPGPSLSQCVVEEGETCGEVLNGCGYDTFNETNGSCATIMIPLDGSNNCWEVCTY